VATLFAWMQTSAQFYTLRLILGLAESGAYPGATSSFNDGILELQHFSSKHAQDFFWRTGMQTSVRSLPGISKRLLTG